DKFRQYVGMQHLDLGTQRRKKVARRYNDQLELDRGIDLPLPVVEAADPWDDADAGGQTLLHQGASQAFGILRRRASTENNNLIGHLASSCLVHSGMMLILCSRPYR